MNQDFADLNSLDMFKLHTLEDLKKRSDVISRIRLDVTPKIMMEPRFARREGDLEKLREITGYMCYVETAGKKPALMILKIGKTDITSTFGQIDEIPAEMLKKAIEHPVEPEVSGMYAITDEIRDWLKKELGL